MTTVRPVELAPDADVARRSVAERSKLRRELGRLDAICLLIAAIVALDTLGAVARGRGPDAHLTGLAHYQDRGILMAIRPDVR